MIKDVKTLDDSGAFGFPEDGLAAIMVQLFIYSPTNSNGGAVNYEDIYPLLNGDGYGCFDNSGPLLAINANSPNRRLAGEFIASLLTEELQSSPELIAMPVHYKAGDEKARLSYENFLDAGFEPTEGFDLEANIAMFEEMAAKLNSVGCGDRLIQNFLRDELASFFDGGQTAWQCAENLQARLTMYLNE